MPANLQHPYLLLVLTTLFWSGNMVIGRAIRDQVPPLSLAFWRWAIALALVFPLALLHLRALWPLLRSSWKAIIVLGLLGVGGEVRHARPRSARAARRTRSTSGPRPSGGKQSATGHSARP